MIAPDDDSPAAAPAATGLVLRPFRGPADYPAMVEVVNRHNAAIGEQWIATVETIADEYAHLTRSDPFSDLVVAEVDGRPAGYTRGFWWEDQDGPFIYGATTFMDPDRQGQGIGRAMLRWIEARQRVIAAEHPPERPKVFQRFVGHKQTAFIALLEAEGYRPARYTFNMVRPTLDDIPDFPLPDGLEIRPVRPEHYRLIWEADIEAFQDHWGVSTPTEEDYQAWL